MNKNLKSISIIFIVLLLVLSFFISFLSYDTFKTVSDNSDTVINNFDDIDRKIKVFSNLINSNIDKQNTDISVLLDFKFEKFSDIIKSREIIINVAIDIILATSYIHIEANNFPSDKTKIQNNLNKIFYGISIFNEEMNKFNTEFSKIENINNIIIIFRSKYDKLVDNSFIQEDLLELEEVNHKFGIVFLSIVKDLEKNLCFQTSSLVKTIKNDKKQKMKEFRFINKVFIDDLYSLNNFINNNRNRLIINQNKINKDTVKVIVFISFLFILLIAVSIALAIILNKYLKVISKEKKLTTLALETNNILMKNVSHDIGNGISKIKGYTELIYKNKNDDIYENLDIILNTSNKIENTINMIRDINSIDNMKNLKLNLSPTILSNLINKLVDNYKVKMKKKNISFNLITNYKDCSYQLNIDYSKLKSILVNLLDNSLKFTENGKIVLSINLIEDKEDNILLEFKIKDTGIGIKKEAISSIFNMYNQADETIQEIYGGYGQGLAICKNYIELMGGVITCKSSLNIGTEFIFRLRLDKIASTEDIFEDLEVPIENMEKSSILVVDDDESLRFLIKNKIEILGYDVILAYDGFMALEILKKSSNKINLILLDIRMPRMNGIVLIEKIKELGIMTPVVSVSANNSEKEQEVYLKAGFVYCLGKPVETNELNEVIDTFIK